jgi:hypothetical protein
MYVSRVSRVPLLLLFFGNQFKKTLAMVPIRNGREQSSIPLDSLMSRKGISVKFNWLIHKRPSPQLSYFAQQAK